MRRNIVSTLVAFTAGLAAASACAMSAVAPSSCRVVAGDKFLAELGGSAALCGAVERAVGERAPGARYSAEVTIINPSLLKTELTVEGRNLPQQSFSVSDRGLSAYSIGIFAQSVADQVAGAKNR